jgi:flagellar biogenesis protein FliO
VLKKFGSRITGTNGSGIRIQEMATVGPANLAVVTVRGRTLLLGSTATSVACLADLSVAEAEPPTFHEILESEQESPSPSGLSDLAGQLERLRRIGG